MKGGARLASIHPIGTLSHVLETLLEGISSEQIKQYPMVLSLAQRAVDKLAEQVNQVKSGGPVAKANALLSELEYTHDVVTGKITPRSQAESDQSIASAIVAPVIPTMPATSPEQNLVSTLNLTTSEPEEYDPLEGEQELQEIFLEEAQELLGKLDTNLQEWFGKPEDLSLLMPINRILHTLKGSARLAGLKSIGNLSHALEAPLQHLTLEAVKQHADILTLAQRTVDKLAELVNQVHKGGPIARAKGLIEQLDNIFAAIRGQKPEDRVQKTDVPSVTAVEQIVDEEEPLTGDPELLSIFLEEAKDLLEQLDSRLNEWANATNDTNLPRQIKHTLHTIKGSARLAGIQAIGTLSHTLETLLDGLTPELIQTHGNVLLLAQRAADRINNQVEQVRKGHAVSKALPLLDELEYTHAVVTGKTPPPPKERKVETKVQKQEDVSKKPDVKTQKAAEATSVVSAQAPSEVKKTVEQVKVQADLLNRLISNAGEVSIYGARLEQHNTNLKFNLVELNQTVTILNDRLRQMTMETEAQMRFRKGDEKEEVGESSQKELDPLELDRFSTIQLLSRTLAETVNDLLSIRSLLGEQQKEAETLLVQHSRISNDLQDGLLRTRMVPFAQQVYKLSALVRNTATGVGKKAKLVVLGAEGEMDRNILDRIVAPIEHILRNAVGHGIELPEKRKAANKDETGKVTITLSKEGNEILIAIADDGGGLNLPAIRKKALETGLLKPGMHMEDNDVMQLILQPGFSTAAAVTQLSGRGVGTDVVVNEVKQLGGSLEIDSEFGKGTTFLIRLPFTLAITQAMLVNIGDDVFAIPHSIMEGVVRINSDELSLYESGEKTGFKYLGHSYNVRYLGMLLGVTSERPTGRRSFPHLLVRSGDHRVALQVDQIIGLNQIVMKSVGPQLSSVSWISGGTILVDGRVALILDISALIRIDTLKTQQNIVTKAQIEKPIVVMVVDDSITVRKVTTRILQRHNMNVIAAKDGMDAVSKLAEQIPDIMLLDVEMPVMNGYELATFMRNSTDSKINNVPIIMITSRTGEKHKKIGMDLGVKRYLGKPYQEGDLLENMYAVLAEVGAR
jgi:chemosensory pili system protein ChpA (sensor histidine kinase/response regulator)